MTSIQKEFKEKNKYEINKNYWRTHYHVTPDTNWMNDPNGFSYYNGEYHLFYQHHPFSPQWGPMHWGHVKSKDLVQWERLPVALTPDREYDKDGCFSGSAIEKDGELYLMYTGNVWTGGDHDKELKQVQCLAKSSDGVTFTKLDQNPVISEPPEGDIHPFHFRDPKVWRHEGIYYCVLGSKTNHEHGQVLLYKSGNLFDWEFVNVLAKSDGKLGYMWECPDFFTIENTDILVFSPQGVSPKDHLYHNVHQAGYVTGKLDYETGIMKHNDFQLLDYGFDYYAPQSTEGENGERILVNWMNMWESEMPEQDYGWAGAIGLPRSVHIKGNRLFTPPVESTKELRKAKFSLADTIISGTYHNKNIHGDVYELELEVDLKEVDSEFTIHLRENEDSSEKTILQYDKNANCLRLNRESSGKGPGGVRELPISLYKNSLELRIFVDRSSVEIFINNGEYVMSSRIYPSESSQFVSFHSTGNAKIKQLNKWDLKKSID